MLSVIVFIIILSFLVFIHELGHFIAAKWAGVVVQEFGLGYPPKAIKIFTWRGTEFSLNWIPFGGFVRMEGEEEDFAVPGGEEDVKRDRRKKGTFYGASAFQKMVIILSGAATNFLFGIIAFAITFTLLGIPQATEEPLIGDVMPESPAADAGLARNYKIDRIVVDQQEYNVDSTEEVVGLIADHRGQQVVVVAVGPCEAGNCLDQEEHYPVYLRTEEETPQGQGSLGIVFMPVIFVQFPWWEMPLRGIWYGAEQAIYLSQLILVSLGNVLKDFVVERQVPSDLAGPIGIVHQAQSSGLMAEGFLAVLSFAAMLSINLAIFNVLPIPPLDGGRAIFIALEEIFSEKTAKTLQYYLQYGGLIFLLLLIILVTAQDIFRIISG